MDSRHWSVKLSKTVGYIGYLLMTIAIVKSDGDGGMMTGTTTMMALVVETIYDKDGAESKQLCLVHPEQLLMRSTKNDAYSRCSFVFETKGYEIKHLETD